MNVLSVFDGISCGQLALQRARIKYQNYYASEIDKYALAVTNYRFPNTVQLGDIREWREWQLPQIDLIMGGSPCQGFSTAGKQLNFDDPRSRLFFDFIDILQYYKPKYFLLENVKMKKEWQNIITQYMGVEPILIDSALVSAQSRKRLYWTNIPDVKQPKDKGILLKHIIEDGYVDRNKSYCINASNNASPNNYFRKHLGQIVFPEQYLNEFYKSDKAMLFAKRHNVKLCYPRDKAFAITTSFYKAGKQERRNDVKTNDKWRKLTPIECERLQTIPDDYTLVPHPVYKGKPMSKTQRYKMLGNAWTIDVIAHIMKGIKSEWKRNYRV